MASRRASGPLSPAAKKKLLKIPESSRYDIVVYHRPGSKKEGIKFVKDEVQGVWAENSSAHQNPCLLWAFPYDTLPDGLTETEHTQGIWGYMNGVDGKDPKKFQATDIFFYAPNAKLSSELNKKGLWSYPLVERDISHLKDYETAFLPIGESKKSEKLDVGGAWKLLYKNDGGDAPIGPGMKSKSKKVPPPMKIKVRTPEGKLFELDVKPDDTIDETKDKVLDKTGIPKDSQRLTFDGKELDDPTTLKKNKIKNGDILDLDPMQITVKHWDGSIFPLLVTPDEDIDSIKNKIKKHKDIPKPQQRLKFGSTPLTEDANTLDDYGIKHKSVVELLPMEIKVRTPDGTLYPIAVTPEDTVADLKKKVEKETDTPVPDQVLSFEGEELDDKPTLDDYDINHGDIVDLGGMEIFVKHPSGWTIPLKVSPSDTLDSIKDRVSEEKDIPKENQRLSYDGKPMKKDGDTLSDYAVKNKDTLMLEPMSINVRTPEGRKIKLKVDPDDTVEDIKKKVEEKLEIPVPDQTLLFKDTELDDPTTLNENGIRHGDTLDLQPAMKIHVKHWDGTTITLDVKPEDTLDSVKSTVNEKMGIPNKQQRLMFDGKPLRKDSKTLEEYKIKDQDTLILEPMEVHVKTPDGQTLTFRVEPTDTIEDVKDKVEEEVGMPVPDQRMLFEGEELKDAPTLEDYNIQNGDTLFLDPMKIHVKHYDGRIITLDVQPDDKIDDIKERVEEKADIPKDQQRLTFNNKPLDDPESTLRDYDIKHDDTLNLEPMEIKVKTPDGKIIPIQVEPTDTVDDVRKKVGEATGEPAPEEDIVFNGNVLDDPESTLADNGVKHGDTLLVEPMQINVKHWDGTVVTLDVNPNDTIGDIKSMVDDEMDIPPAYQRMKFDGKPLKKNKKSLKDYNIKNKDTIELEPMQINVKTPNGKKIPIEVEPSDTIEDIKQKVEDATGLPVPTQKLRNPDGDLLDNPTTVADNGIKHGDTLTLDPMKIYVKKPDGEKIELAVKPSDSVEDVKKMVEDIAGIPVPDQTLTFDGDELDDPTTLDDNDIKDGDTLVLEPMRVNVKHWDGTVETFDVAPDDTIEHIKSLVDDKMDIPPEQQRLVFEGKPLKKDSKTLREYKIANGDTIDLQPMTVNVKTPDGKVIPIQVDPHDTIEQVKNKVEDATGIPTPSQKLRDPAGELLDNPTTIADNGIKHGDTLELDPMKIFVKKPNGEKIELAVSPTNIIADIKDMVEDKDGIPVGDQHMEFDGKDLKDEPTLTECKIRDGDTIDLVPMEIIVKHWNNAIFYFPVEPDFTLDQVKDMIEKKPPKIEKDRQKLTFKEEPIEEDDKTLRQYGIKHRDVIKLVKTAKKEPVKEKPKKKSYLPENWKEEVEKKYGTVKTTTYRTNYSGDNDESFFQGKIGETEETFKFSEVTTKTKGGEKKMSHKFN